MPLLNFDFGLLLSVLYDECFDLPLPDDFFPPFCCFGVEKMPFFSLLSLLFADRLLLPSYLLLLCERPVDMSFFFCFGVVRIPWLTLLFFFSLFSLSSRLRED
jgi:hypothetical protein